MAAVVGLYVAVDGMKSDPRLRLAEELDAGSPELFVASTEVFAADRLAWCAWWSSGARMALASYCAFVVANAFAGSLVDPSFVQSARLPSSWPFVAVQQY